MKQTFKAVFYALLVIGVIYGMESVWAQGKQQTQNTQPAQTAKNKDKEKDRRLPFPFFNRATINSTETVEKDNNGQGFGNAQGSNPKTKPAPSKPLPKPDIRPLPANPSPAGKPVLAQAPLVLKDVVIREDARTLRAKQGFEFAVGADKKISVVERKSGRRIVLDDGICAGGCASCSAILDMDRKVRCLGCNGDSACALKSL